MSGGTRPRSLTGQEDNQGTAVDDGFRQEPGVVAVFASRDEMEVHRGWGGRLKQR